MGLGPELFMNPKIAFFVYITGWESSNLILLTYDGGFDPSFNAKLNSEISILNHQPKTQ